MANPPHSPQNICPSLFCGGLGPNLLPYVAFKNARPAVVSTVVVFGVCDSHSVMRCRYYSTTRKEPEFTCTFTSGVYLYSVSTVRNPSSHPCGLGPSTSLQWIKGWKKQKQSRGGLPIMPKLSVYGLRPKKKKKKAFWASVKKKLKNLPSFSSGELPPCIPSGLVWLLSESVALRSTNPCDSSTADCKQNTANCSCQTYSARLWSHTALTCSRAQLKSSNALLRSPLQLWHSEKFTSERA